MRIWQSIFGWESFFSWGTVGVTVGIIATIGWGLVTADVIAHNLLFAQISFGVAGLILLAKIIGHAVESSDKWWHRVLFTFFLSGIICMGVAETIRALQKAKHKGEVASLQHNESQPTTPEITDIRSRIEYVYAVHWAPTDQTLIFVLVNVTNTGVPTALTGWKLSIKSASLNVNDVPYTIIPETLEITQRRSIVATFHSKECLYEKAAKALQKGDILSGYVPFAISGDHWREIIHGKPLLTVSFKDYKDRPYQASQTIEKPEVPRGLPGAEPAFVRDPNAVEKEHTTSQESPGKLPDITLRFVYPKSPAVLLVNSPQSLARDIKWSVVLWNLDLPDRNDPLPIPVQTFDWLRPGDSGGPQDILGAPSVAPLVKPGNRLMGSASVICPTCERGHTYIVYIVWDQGGWYAEVKNEKSGSLLIPRKFDPATKDLFFQQYQTMVPETDRIPIGDWP